MAALHRPILTMTDLIANLTLGFTVAFSLQNIGFCLIGVLVGTLVGVLPGLGTLAAIAMLLPITYGLDPTGAIIMLAGIYYGSQYGGSTTSILVNLPGESSSVITTLDGHQMARQGRAGAALAIAAISSLIAGCFATLLVAAVAVPLIRVALLFGPAEYFSVVILGLIMSVVLARGSLPKALAMLILGLLLSTVGLDLVTAQERMTFGLLKLTDGVGIVSLALGLFGLAEIIRNLEIKSDQRFVIGKISGLMPTRQDFKESSGAIARGTLIGSALGVLPGGGAIMASFAAYAIEKKSSRHPERFGHGTIAGVAAPESANNAAAQTSFIPFLTLGIAPNPVIAVMAGALLIQGIHPGPQVMSEQPQLFWGLIASMFIGNLMLVVINLPLIGIWIQLLKVPYRLLFPMVLVFATIGVFSVHNDPTDVLIAAILGLIGYCLLKYDFEPAPLLLGYVLGPLLESNLRRAMLIAHGDATVFLTRPLSAAFLLVAAALLTLAVLPMLRRRREEVFVE